MSRLGGTFAATRHIDPGTSPNSRTTPIIFRSPYRTMIQGDLCEDGLPSIDKHNHRMRILLFGCEGTVDPFSNPAISKCMLDTRFTRRNTYPWLNWFFEVIEADILETSFR
jgi:hypothetical protein